MPQLKGWPPERETMDAETRFSKTTLLPEEAEEEDGSERNYDVVGVAGVEGDEEGRQSFRYATATELAEGKFPAGGGSETFDWLSGGDCLGFDWFAASLSSSDVDRHRN